MSYELDYYAILDITPDADEQAIKRAHRRMARRFHPDVNPESDARQRFDEIQEAYELLSNAQKRQAYDHWRRQQGLDVPPPIIVRITPSQNPLPCLGEPQLLYVLTEIIASAEAESSRAPINLCLVLDRSTSMKGSRLHQVKEAARYILDQMEPSDILSIVSFSDRAELVLPGQRIIDKARAKIAVSSIRSGGGTEIYQGLHMGLQQVERWQAPNNVSHLILLTDGQTYGDEDKCLDAARHAGERKIPITPMGIGSDWNDELLDEMARLSHAPGSSIYIDSTAKIAEAFHDQFRYLGSTLVHNLSLMLHLGKGVTIQDAFRVSPNINQLTSTNGKYTLGALDIQKPQAVIMEVLVESHSPGTHRLMQMEISGTVPTLGSKSLALRQAMELDFAANLDRRQPVPHDIVSAMGKLTIFKMQERAMSEIEQGQIEPAVRRLKTMATRLLDIGEAELARAALLEAGRLAQTGALSAEGRKKIRYGTQALRILPKEVRHDKVSIL